MSPFSVGTVCSGIGAPEDCPDGPRYKAIGNSMAVTCMAWIGERLEREVARARSQP